MNKGRTLSCMRGNALSPLRFFLVFITLIFVSSCATEVAVEKVPEMYWPMPPEKPRIKFVDIILGNLDAKTRAGTKIKNFIFGSEADGRFIKPFGVAVRGKRMYVSDISAVYYFDFNSGRVTTIGGGDLAVPSAIDATADRIYVADTGKRKIYVFDLEGNLKLEFGGKEISTPGGIAVDEKRGRVIVSDSRNHRIQLFSLDGRLISTFGSRGRGAGEFNVPYGIDVDREGRIYVVDSMNFRVQIFDADGGFIKSIGSIGMSAGRFARPKGVALDSDGHIYVLDSAFGNFQIFDFEGNTLLAVGANGRETAEFSLPSSIYIDEHDEIYVVDQMNRRIQVFRYLKDN